MSDDSLVGEGGDGDPCVVLTDIEFINDVLDEAHNQPPVSVLHVRVVRTSGFLVVSLDTTRGVDDEAQVQGFVAHCESR